MVSGGGGVQNLDEKRGLESATVDGEDPRSADDMREKGIISIGRAQAKRTPAGTYTCQLADPLRPGQKLRVTASTLGEFENRVRMVQSVRRELTLSMISPEEARKRLGRIQSGASTVDDLYKLFAESIRRRWGKKAASVWAHRLAPYFSGRRAWELTEDALRAWEAKELDCGLSRHTIANAFYVLKKSYRLGMARGLIDAIPWGEWHPKYPRKRIMVREGARNLEELAALLHAARERDSRMRELGRPQDACVLLKLLVLTLTGLRQGEAAALGWDALELEADPPTVSIRFAVTEGWARENPAWDRPRDPPKNGVHDPIALHPDVVRALKWHREAMTRMGWFRADGPVFPGRSGRWRLTPSILEPTVIRELVRAVGLPNVDKWVTHSTRHTFATLEVQGAAAAGLGVHSVMDRTRHASIEVLQGYLHAARRGRVASQIPSLAHISGVVVPRLGDVDAVALPSQVEGALVSSVAEAGASDLEVALARADARARTPVPRRVPRLREGASFREVAREWVASGQPANAVPDQVRDEAKAAYERRRQQELRAGVRNDLANLAARRSSHGVMMAWRKAVVAATRGPAVDATKGDGNGH